MALTLVYKSGTEPAANGTRTLKNASLLNAEIDGNFKVIENAYDSLSANKADLASPALTGTPTAPTATAGTSTTQLATTAFVGTAITNERTATATLTNKTLTSPTINTPTIGTSATVPLVQGSTAASGTLTLSSTSNATKGSVLVGSGTDTVRLNTTTDGIVYTSGANGTLTYNTTYHYRVGGTDIAVADGGTGLSTTPTNGQLLIGNGTGYSLATISNGSGISVTNGAGTITLANTGVTSVTGSTNQVTVSGSTGAVTFSLPQDINSTATPSFSQVLLGGDPAQAMHAATRQYVDNAILGLDVKASVKAATTANITLAGGAPNTLDGVSLSLLDRILVKNQTTPAQNGIYYVATLGTGANGTWERAADMDNWNEVPGSFVFVEGGTTNGDTGWANTSAATGTLGTTDNTWSQFFGTGTVTAGTGISVSGNQISLATSNVSSLYSLGTTGIVARTAANTVASRTITGTASRLSVTNGDGVAGNPTIDIDSSYVGQTSITTLGTIATGTWNATAIADGKIASALTGKTYNGLSLTANASGFSVAGGTTSKTLTVSNTLTFTGTDSSSVSFGSGGTVAYTANKLSAFAATTSAELAGVISDETGSGSLVFATSPTLTTPTVAVVNGSTAASGTLTLRSTSSATKATAGVIMDDGIASTSTTTGTLKVTGGVGISGAVFANGFQSDGAVTISSNGTNTNVNLVPSGAGSVDVSNKRITSVSDPTGAQDAATKAYVDAVKTGLNVKDTARVATTANLTATYANGTSGVGATLTNSGTLAALAIDGITLATNDRVLVKDQSAGAQNGIYTVTNVGSASVAWILTRTTDFDSSTEVGGGDFVFVEDGTTNADAGFVVTTNGTITFGTTSITWTQFSGAGQITAGAGLIKTGNTLDVVGTASRIVVNADSIDIDSAYVGQTSITTLGTVATGTWNATAIADGKIASALTGKTYNGLSLTANASGFSVAGGTTSKTLTISNSLTFTGTDSSSVAFGAGGTVAYTANKLNAFAATTSAELLSIISDETGSGSLVFATSPSLTTPTIGGAGANFSGSTSGTSTLKAAAVAGTTTFTLPSTTGTLIGTGDTGTVTSAMIADGTIVNGDISASAAIAISKLAASTISGVSLGNNLNALTISTGLSGSSYNGSGAVTIAIDTNVVVDKTTAQTLTNKSLSDSTTFFVDETDATKKLQFQLSGITTATTRTLTIPNVDGTIVTTGDSGTVTSTMIASTLSGKTYNGLSLTANASGFSVAGGTTSKTLTVSNTLTFTGTDSSSVAFGAGGTVLYTSNKLSALAATTSAELAGVISDETGSGSLVFATSPALAGTPTAPTAATGTNTTQIATTAFVITNASDLAMAMAIALG